MDDRAANYIFDSNLIKVNADFRSSQIWLNVGSNCAPLFLGSEALVGRLSKSSVNGFEQQRIETAMSAHALRKGGKWNTEEVCKFRDENALTAAVLPRYRVDVSIKRTLGQKLGTFK